MTVIVPSVSLLVVAEVDTLNYTGVAISIALKPFGGRRSALGEFVLEVIVVSKHTRIEDIDRFSIAVVDSLESVVQRQVELVDPVNPPALGLIRVEHVLRLYVRNTWYVRLQRQRDL
jgi:hypothetical protein